MVGLLVLSGVGKIQPFLLLSSEFRWCLFPEARLESRYAGSEMVLGFVPACVVVSGGCDRQSSMASRWSPEAPLHFRSIPNGTLSSSLR